MASTEAPAKPWAANSVAAAARMALARVSGDSFHVGSRDRPAGGGAC